jgi:hypothetical protein
VKGERRVEDGETVLTFCEQRYLFVRRILPQPILDYLKVYYSILMANKVLDHDTQCPWSLAIGGDRALDAMLEWLRPTISRIVGIELAPTYSYTRRYAKGDILARHIDRPACEISITVSIQIPQGAKPSTIYLKPPCSNEIKVEMFEGDGCIYVGTQVEHWRDPFDIEGYIQLFLHYIRKDNPDYARLVYDGREFLGVIRA